MAMEIPHEPHLPEEDPEEISVGVSEDGMVLLEGEDWGFELSPQQARELADALREMADAAEQPDETTP